MAQIEDRYISLLTDFGFKRIFGTVPNKELLICFLNSLFDGKQVIKDVKYLNNEHLGDVYVARKAIFDVYCEGENGEKFIVEMRNVYQEFSEDLPLCFSLYPTRNRDVKASSGDFDFTHVYTVVLSNLALRKGALDATPIYHDVKLNDTTSRKVLQDFIYVSPL